MKETVILLIALILVGGGVYYFATRDTSPEVTTETEETTEVEEVETEEEGGATNSETETDDEESSGPIEVIGSSANGNDITAYHYGSGDTELLFVGGIHGGYEWNTVLVAYELMDHLEADPDTVPENVKVTVIPVLNPDGLSEVVGTTGRFDASDVTLSTEQTVPGRFNGNEVDLNRNFDCDWQSVGTWQDRTVNGGSAAFSEPESQAIRDYVAENNPDAAVVWYSAAGGVFASNCHNGVLDETSTLTNLFADASGYPAYQEFDFYEITGDMVNWLASENIPAISVLLTNHQDVEWNKNRAGVEAILEYYAE